MMTPTGRFALIVDDHDEALRFYQDTLGFETLVDFKSDDGFRLIHLGLPNQHGVGLWLLEAQTEAESALVGRQAEGQPLLVFYTDDFRRDYDRLSQQGVEFVGQPQHDPDAIHVHFNDPYGNRNALVQLLDDRQRGVISSTH